MHCAKLCGVHDGLQVCTRVVLGLGGDFAQHIRCLSRQVLHNTVFMPSSAENSVACYLEARYVVRVFTWPLQSFASISARSSAVGKSQSAIVSSRLDMA
jgi:hypothetical protein